MTGSSAGIALPTPDVASSPAGSCAVTRVDAVLRGDPRDPLIAWIVDAAGVRRDVVWPSGYHARFAPSLEVLDATGALVLRAGDPITRTCGITDDGRTYLAPPFR